MLPANDACYAMSDCSPQPIAMASSVHAANAVTATPPGSSSAASGNGACACAAWPSPRWGWPSVPTQFYGLRTIVSDDSTQKLYATDNGYHVISVANTNSLAPRAGE